MKDLRLRSTSYNSVPEFIVLVFFLLIPFLIGYISRIQEVSDLLISKMKPEYLLNKEENFDFIIGMNLNLNQHLSLRCNVLILSTFY